jgi:hypothetical protein
LIRELIKHGILQFNEEEEIIFNAAIQSLRKVIKENIEKGDFNFSYNLNFKLERDEQ